MRVGTMSVTLGAVLAAVVALTVPGSAAYGSGRSAGWSSWSGRATPQPPASTAESPAAAALSEGRRLLQRRDLDGARQQFERARGLARAEGRRDVEGAAHRGLAAVLSRQTKYLEAKEALERSLSVLEESGSHTELASSHNDLGTVEFFLNRFDAARDHYLKALGGFEAAGDVGEQANLHRNLYFVTVDPSEKLMLLERGFDLAQSGGALQLQGDILHAWSDALFSGGRLAEAMDKLEMALDRLEAAGDGGRTSLTRALTSLGRLHRAHGHHDAALDAYRRALRIQQTLGDRVGMIQSMNAIGVAWRYLGNLGETRRWCERALELAHETGSPLIIDFMTRALAGILIDTDDPARGVAMLEGLVRTDPKDYDHFRVLANGYLRTGRYAQAVESATTSIVKARAHGALDLMQSTLSTRARAREKLGQLSEALADAREAIALIENVRTEVIPTDAMKRGFAQEHQYLFTLTIELLNRLGRDRDALDVAEQGRARAFADLLASRDFSPPPGERTAPSASSKAEAWRGPNIPASSDAIRIRGGEASPRAVTEPRLPRDLKSLASAAPLSSADLARLARRLDSRLVSYWVAPDATYVWVVSGTGEVGAMRIDVSERRLTELIRQTWTIGRAEAPRGEPAGRAPAGGAAMPGGSPVLNQAIADPIDTRWTPRVRGEGLLSLGGQAVAASRALHRLLIVPIGHLLPTASGGLLTIIPHGPLFLLSFAALQDAAGQYLVERYATHYVPAGVVLQLAQQHAESTRPIDRRYLLIADPRTPPALPDGTPLPRLPGTQREIRRVGALMPAPSVTSLVGARATEDRVRRLAGDQSVIHFATHGVIRADDPLGSFLALDVGSAAALEHRPPDRPRATGPSSSDGRLTAREIYDLNLKADLVVLSACRTGLGPVSGDGVVGLARAFLYAGTPSVVATLWDVADEPAALLMPDLYRSLRHLPDKAQALRRAQLALLRELRAGNVTVTTSSGPITLREHPILWAGFIMVGLP